MRLYLRLAGVAVGCLIIGLGLALFLLSTWLHAPAHHSVQALQYLLLSGAVSLALGVLTVVAVVRFAPNLELKVAVASLCGSVAATVNVAVTPLLMFSERTDKYILIITLLYFLALSLAFASIVGVITARQLRALRDGALRLAAGNFDTRVSVTGMDEIADLGRTFNLMSAQLGDAFQRERQMERERRDLIVGVSHDLRTPLAVIRAMVEAINDGVVTEPGEVTRYLKLIQSETQHLGQLIDDLFELARLERGSTELKLSSVPLPELVVDTVDGLQLHAREKGIDLTVSVDNAVPALALDGPRMQRVFINLIENALRHTGAGGQVRVDVGCDTQAVRVAVEDTGEGIPAEEQPLVFDRFYRGDRARSRVYDSAGAGLGLAIARSIVEAHRGSIILQSQPGEGSRFVVSLPAPPRQ